MTSAEKYVAAAYLVVFIGVLAWVAIIGTKLARQKAEREPEHDRVEVG